MKHEKTIPLSASLTSPFTQGGLFYLSLSRSCLPQFFHLFFQGANKRVHSKRLIIRRELLTPLQRRYEDGKIKNFLER